MKAVYKASRNDNGWQRFNILTSPTKLRSNESFLVEYTMFEMIMNFELYAKSDPIVWLQDK